MDPVNNQCQWIYNTIEHIRCNFESLISRKWKNEEQGIEFELFTHKINDKVHGQVFHLNCTGDNLVKFKKILTMDRFQQIGNDEFFYRDNFDSQINRDLFEELWRISDGISPFSEELQSHASKIFFVEKYNLYASFSLTTFSIIKTCLNSIKCFNLALHVWKKDKKLTLPLFLKKKIFCYISQEELSTVAWDSFVKHYQWALDREKANK